VIGALQVLLCAVLFATLNLWKAGNVQEEERSAKVLSVAQVLAIPGAKAGMLAFKRDGDDVHHVGIVTEKGTVIHSSSVYGRVVETPLDNSWHLLAQHKLIDPAEGVQTDQPPANDAEEDEYDTGDLPAYTSLMRSDGVTILLAGSWRVAND